MVIITALNIVVVIMAYLARIEKHRYLLAWAFMLMIMVLGIRYGYGNDYYSYEYFFNHGELDEGNSENVELGWRLINNLFKPFGFPTLVFFLTAIEHLMLYDLVRRYIPANYYWFALFLYVFNPNYMLIGLSMMRQFPVQIIGLYALEKAIDKKYFQFIFLFLIAFSIHKVALLFFLLLLLPYIKTPKWWMFIGIFVVLFLIVNNLMMIIEEIIILIQGTEMKYADTYLNDQVLGDESKLGLKHIIHYFVFMVVFIHCVKYVDERKRAFAWMVILGVMILPFQMIFPMAMRTSWIYSFAEILGLPLLLSKEKIPILKYGLTCLFIFNVLFFEYRSFWWSDIYGAYYRNFTTILSE